VSSKIELSDALKLGMRNLASGVCVVSTRSSSGERVAMTASSVTSVSDSPASLLVCINREARLDGILSQSDEFSVSVLAEHHKEVSDVCAKPCEGESRFAVGSWCQDARTQLSYLDDALSVFFCDKQQAIAHGTHNIYIANVTKVITSDSEGSPLVYAKGAYHSL